MREIMEMLSRGHGESKRMVFQPAQGPTSTLSDSIS